MGRRSRHDRQGGEFPDGRGWFTLQPESNVDRAWNVAGWMPPQSYVVGDVTMVELTPEYGVELPLTGGEWWQLGLPSTLLDRLADWQDVFESNFQPGGWTDDAARQAWIAEADSLVTDLEHHLPSGVVFQVDLWPLAEDTDADT